MGRVVAHLSPSKSTGTQPATVTVGLTSTEILAAPAGSGHTYLLMQNIGANDVYIDLTGGTPTVGGGFLLAASGGSLELVHWVPQAVINGIADTVASSVQVIYTGS